MHKDKKKIYIKEMRDFFSKTSSVYVTHYQGLTVKQIDELRAEMRKHGIIFNFELFFANLVKILAEVIASSENATAVGPVNKFSNFLNLLPSRASFVILFFVILKRIPCILISALNSSICFTVRP